MLRGRAQQERELRLPGTALQLLADLAQGIGHAGQGGERLLHTAMHVRAQFGDAAFAAMPATAGRRSTPWRRWRPFDGAAPRSGHGARAAGQRYIPAWCDIGASLDLAALFSGHVMGPPGRNPADPDDPRRSGGLQRAQRACTPGMSAPDAPTPGLSAPAACPPTESMAPVSARETSRKARPRARSHGSPRDRSRRAALIVSLHQGPAVGVRGSHSGSGARAAAVRPQPSISACARSACSRAIQARQTFRPRRAHGPPAARRRRPGPAVPPRPPPPPSGARASAAARGGQRHVPGCTKAVTRAPGASPPARQGCAAWPIAARSCPRAA